MSMSAGVFFYSKLTRRFLYLLRKDNKNPGYWGIPGGKIEVDESLLEGLERECQEELNYWPTNQKFVNNNFVYHTFFCAIEHEFIPILNDEHCGYAWVGDNQYPKPLHPGVFNMINFDLVQQKLLQLTT
jgi:8-oxo-dGTP pyrophosphatase MutT (NUDIX family)